MIIYTSYFKLWEEVPNPICISIGKLKEFIGKDFPGLFPTWEMIQQQKNMEISSFEYISQYLDLVFNKRFLTIQMILQTLPKICTFICWEGPNSFCHRHILSYIFNVYGNCKTSEWNTIKNVYKLNDKQKQIIDKFFNPGLATQEEEKIKGRKLLLKH